MKNLFKKDEIEVIEVVEEVEDKTFLEAFTEVDQKKIAMTVATTTAAVITKNVIDLIFKSLSKK